jgi:hypothetical protein
MKSISPIIATILIIIITIAIFLIFYAFTQSSPKEIHPWLSRVVSFTINNVSCSNHILYFDIYNNGNVPININNLNAMITFIDNNGNPILIPGSDIICNNGNIIPAGSSSLCYLINAFCYYSYTDYIKSAYFSIMGYFYKYGISNNNFNLLPFYPYFFQPTNLTISSSNSQGYLAQLPQCNITSNPYGGSTGMTGLLNCIAINFGAISAVVWFYEPSNGQGILLSFQNAQYPNDPNNLTPWLYVGTNGYLYAGDWAGFYWQISTSSAISPGWHMAVVEEYYSRGTHYIALYLDGRFVGQVSETRSTPQLFLSFPYDDIGTGFVGIWPAGNGNWFFFNGTIAYIALYNTVLNQTQVQQLYQSGLDFPNTLFSNNLVAAYILTPAYYNNNSYYFASYYSTYYFNAQLINLMGINNYHAISITPNGSIGPIPSSQFIYEHNPPLS